MHRKVKNITLVQYEEAFALGFQVYNYLDGLKYLVNNKQNMKNAIFPGSFDPFTLGHLDIVKKSEKIFDKIIIGI